jgi:hypothetical protein
VDKGGLDMANKILTDEGYENRIRGVLGIDAAYLPDEVINGDDFLTVGEINIIDLMPDYASKTGDDKIRLIAATVCEVARLICPTLPVRLPKTQQGPHGKYDLQSIDWHKKEQELLDKRDTLLGKLIANGVDAGNYFFGIDLTAPYSLRQ